MGDAARIGAWVWVAIASLAAIGALMDGWHWIAALALAGSALISMPLAGMRAEAEEQGVSGRQRIIVAVVLGLVGSTILGANADKPAVAAEARTETKSAVPSLKDADPEIGSVEISGPNVWVTVDLRAIGETKSALERTALVALTIGKAIKGGVVEVGGETQWLQLQVTVPTVDRLGNEDRDRIILARFPIADLKRANYDNLGLRTLNLADLVKPHAMVGQQAVTAFCRDPGDADLFQEFCALAAAG